VLSRLLDTLGISPRTGKGLLFHHVVLLHPKAIIERPAAAQFDTSMVIKADQFPSWHKKFADRNFGVVEFLKLASNIRSLDTIKEWGEKLIRQHRPADLLALPDFMKLSEPPKRQSAAPIPELLPVARTVPSPALQAPKVEGAVSDGNATRKLVCAHCSCKINYQEGKFCWNNGPRFGGLQYCREHQGRF
jgi:hypothetical protein